MRTSDRFSFLPNGIKAWLESRPSWDRITSKTQIAEGDGQAIIARIRQSQGDSDGAHWATIEIEDHEADSLGRELALALNGNARPSRLRISKRPLIEHPYSSRPKIVLVKFKIPMAQLELNELEAGCLKDLIEDETGKRYPE